jgi:hypothetical protein
MRTDRKSSSQSRHAEKSNNQVHVLDGDEFGLLLLQKLGRTTVPKFFKGPNRRRMPRFLYFREL